MYLNDYTSLEINDTLSVDNGDLIVVYETKKKVIVAWAKVMSDNTHVDWHFVGDISVDLAKEVGLAKQISDTTLCNQIISEIRNRYDKLQKLVDQFISLDKSFNGYEEGYKWDIIKRAENKKPLDIISILTSNLMYVNYLSTLKKMKDKEPNKRSSAIGRLFEDEKRLSERLERFKNDINENCRAIEAVEE